eukprot:4344712-Heterocapsa_arctica.AAC.1
MVSAARLVKGQTSRSISHKLEHRQAGNTAPEDAFKFEYCAPHTFVQFTVNITILGTLPDLAPYNT